MRFAFLTIALFSSLLCFSQLKKKELGSYKGTSNSFSIYQEDTVFSIASSDICLKFDKDSCTLDVNGKQFTGNYTVIETQNKEKKMQLKFNDLGIFNVFLNSKEKQLIFIGREQQPSTTLVKLKKKEMVE